MQLHLWLQQDEQVNLGCDISGAIVVVLSRLMPPPRCRISIGRITGQRHEYFTTGFFFDIFKGRGVVGNYRFVESFFSQCLNSIQSTGVLKVWTGDGTYCHINLLQTKVLWENNLPEYQFFSRLATSASQRATREKNWYSGRLPNTSCYIVLQTLWIAL